MKPVLKITVASLALSGVLNSVAVAQESGDGSSVETSRTLGKITVTAQKREENLQNVPIAITALSADAIEDSGGSNIEQLQQLVPSLNFRKGTTSANSALFLRGVGTISFSTAAEPSVSTVVDGVVLSRPGQAFSDLYDIERIEVLRGPQGTLFGRNASAGVVNIITKGGANEFEGEVNLGFFEEGEQRAKISLAGPLSDSVLARFTAYAGEFDGHITNVFGGGDERVNGYERSGARLVVDWEASPDVDFRLTADYSENDDDCCAEITGFSRGAARDAELGFEIGLGEDTRVVNHNLVSRTIGDSFGASAEGKFSIGDHTLTAIASYRNWTNTEIREGDFLPRPFVGQFELHDLGYNETDQSSIEVRLASPQGNDLEYQFGGFYFQSDNFQTFLREDVTCAASTLPADPISGVVPCDLSDTANTIFPRSNSISDVDITNYAVFGQATYHLSDRLHLTGGLRYTSDDVEFTHTRAPGINATDLTPASGPGVRGDGAGGVLPNGNGTNVSAGQTDSTNFSGKAVLAYDFNDDVSGYASYTKGYKGPAFNVFFNHTVPNNSTPISEETSDAYELGLKSVLFNDRLVLNVAAYYAEYDGFQANNFVNLNGTIITNLTNAGSISTSGFEIDFIAAPTDFWDISGGIAYADAKVEEFNPNPLTNAPDARNGTRLPLAPEWSASLSNEFTIALDRIAPLDLRFRQSLTHQGEQFSALGEAGPLDAHTLVDLALALSDKEDRYRLTFHVKNAFDEGYVLLNTSGIQRLHIPRDGSRYVGATLRARF